MKKILTCAASLFLAILICQPVYAAGQYELLPVEVVNNPNRMEIRKIYEMPSSADPAGIPRADFERDNILYKHTDTLRRVINTTETKSHTELETVESTKRKTSLGNCDDS